MQSVGKNFKKYSQLLTLQRLHWEVAIEYIDVKLKKKRFQLLTENAFLFKIWSADFFYSFVFNCMETYAPKKKEKKIYLLLENEANHSSV